jgi:hypothetical protein
MVVVVMMAMRPDRWCAVHREIESKGIGATCQRRIFIGRIGFPQRNSAIF